MLVRYLKVSIDDELPPVAEPVFCLTKSGKKVVAVRLPDVAGMRRVSNCCSNSRLLRNVTHWLKFEVEE